jgi:hypothetical protein
MVLRRWHGPLMLEDDTCRSSQKTKRGDEMVKKTIFALMVVIMATSLVPSEGMCRYAYHGGSYHGGSHHGYYNDAWLWGVGGLVLGTTIAAVSLQQPPPQTVVYGAPQPAVYAYPPNVPPGMCRWERYVLDGYGRTLLDQRGQPVREYTTGPCQYPPY